MERENFIKFENMKKLILVIILFVSFSCEEKLDNDTKTPLKLEIGNLSVEGEVTTKVEYLSFNSNLRVTATVNDGFTGIGHTAIFSSDRQQVNDGSYKLYYEDLLPIGKYNYSVETIERSKALVLDQSKIENYEKADYMISDETYLSEAKKALITNLKHINVAVEINVSGIGFSPDEFRKFFSDPQTVLTFITRQNNEIMSYKMNYYIDRVGYRAILPVSYTNNVFNFKLTNFNDPNKTVSGTCRINDQPKAGDKIVIDVKYNYKNGSIEASEEEDISSWKNQGEWD